jgi:hypothetical protein
VIEFRRDSEAKKKLRRFRHWLDRDLVGKSVQYVADEIAGRLEDYEWALEKHGIQTVTGTLSDLLDPKVLGGGLVALVGGAAAVGEFWGAVAATGVLAGKATLSCASRLIDLHDAGRGPNAEVAFVHELKKKLGKYLEAAVFPLPANHDVLDRRAALSGCLSASVRRNSRCRCTAQTC